MHPVAQLRAHFKHNSGVCDGLSIRLRVRTATAEVKAGKGRKASIYKQDCRPGCYLSPSQERHMGLGAHLADVMTEGLRGKWVAVGHVAGEGGHSATKAGPSGMRARTPESARFG